MYSWHDWNLWSVLWATTPHTHSHTHTHRHTHTHEKDNMCKNAVTFAEQFLTHRDNTLLSDEGAHLLSVEPWLTGVSGTVTQVKSHSVNNASAAVSPALFCSCSIRLISWPHNHCDWLPRQNTRFNDLLLLSLQTDDMHSRTICKKCYLNLVIGRCWISTVRYFLSLLSVNIYRISRCVAFFLPSPNGLFSNASKNLMSSSWPMLHLYTKAHESQ